jgi:tetratricopeptide (TPR) repeat protein
LDNLDQELQTFDDERQMRSLVNAIAFADGFSLLFVRANQIPQQESLVEQIKANLPDKYIEVIRFDEPVENLLDELQKRLDGKKPDAIFCYNLNNSFPTSTDNFKSPFVVTLNHSRNSFKRTIECPLVLFLPEFALASLYHGAVDFYSIRSGVYLFTPQAVETDRLITQQISQNQWELESLLLEERQNRIETIKNLLSEYKALPNSQRTTRKEYLLKGKLASLYYTLADYDNALYLYEEVQDYAQNSEDNLLLSGILNNLGLIYIKKHKLSKAKDLVEMAIEIQQNIVGTNSVLYASSLANLASIHQKLMEYTKAVRLYQEVIEIDKQTIGTNHPYYANHLNNLAIVYEKQGKYTKAEKLYQESIEIGKNAVGIDSSVFAIRLNNLAWVYLSQKNYNKALSLFRESYDLCRKTLGENHPTTKSTKSSMAKCEQALADKKPVINKKRKPRHKSKKS